MLHPGFKPRQLDGINRTLSTPNAPAEFILNSVSLSENSQYVAEMDKFVPLSEAQRHEDVILGLWGDSAIESAKLHGALELLRQKMRTSEAPKTVTDPRKFSWKDVIAEVQDASDAYKNERGKVKSIFYNMCNNAPLFEHWLSLLPEGDYGASISGAFVMLVRASRNLSEVRRLIYETLASIPDTLAHASTYIDIYKVHSSDILVQQTAALCKSILVLLQLIVQFFLKSSFKRGAAAVFKGGGFEKELKDTVQAMKGQVLKLREEANLCLQKRITEMDRKNDLREYREQSRQQLAKEELLLAIDSSTEITAQKVCTYLLRQLQASPSFNVRTGWPNLPFEGPMQSIKDVTFRSVTPVPIQSGLARRGLLEMLDYDHRSHQKDIERSLKVGYSQDDEAQARAAWILHSAEMGDFLAGNAESKLLLINGNIEATEFISPLSYVCAKISDLISISNQIIFITHFCGYRTDELRDPRANAQGMLASLVGQMYTQIQNWDDNDDERADFNLDLSSISSADWRAIQKEKDLGALFNIFRDMVMQLPENTIVFCLIDSLSAYENSARKDDTVALMQKVARLVKKSTRVALKVLVTAPGHSVYADRWADFGRRQMRVLYVPESL